MISRGLYLLLIWLVTSVCVNPAQQDQQIPLCATNNAQMSAGLLKTASVQSDDFKATREPPRSPEDAQTLNASKLFERLAKGEQFYDTRIRPNYRGRRVQVFCSAFISSISAISEHKMDYTVDFYFRQAWLDWRLQFDASNGENVVNLPPESGTMIWRPDTFFVNAKTSFFHQVTRLNGFLRVKPNGFVSSSSRVTVTAYCPMNFEFFPLDHQRCSLSLESFSLAESDLIYLWSADGGQTAISHYSEDPVDLTGAIAFDSNVSTLPHLVLFGYSLSESYFLRDDGYNHSRLSIYVYFSRNLGFYIIQVYLPAFLMVVASWISLWIPRNSAPARITLAVTTVLTISTLTIQGNHVSTLPKLSYLNALEIFLVTCFMFVFLILVEYAIVSYSNKKLYDFSRSYNPRQFLRARRRGIVSMLFTTEGEAVFSTLIAPITAINTNGSDTDVLARLRDRLDNRRKRRHSAICLAEKKVVPWLMEQDDNNWFKLMFFRTMDGDFDSLPSKIEVASRFLFPVTFLIFNVFYWHRYYFSHHDELESDPGFVFVENGAH